MQALIMHVQSKLLSKLATTCLLVITARWLTFIGCAPITEPVFKDFLPVIADVDIPAPVVPPPTPVVPPSTPVVPPSMPVVPPPPPPPPTGTPLVSPLYVAVGDGGKIALSKDSGSSWEAVTSGITAQLLDIATDGNNIVAVANNGAVVRSTDGGENWFVISSTGISSSTVAEIEYGNGVFVIFTYESGSTPYAFYRSTNAGTTWATGTLATGLFTIAGNTTGINPISLAYANNRFIAARAVTGDGAIAVSSDGLNYTNGLGSSGSARFSSISPVKVRVVNDRYFVLNNASIILGGGSFPTSAAISHASTGTWGTSPWTLLIRDSSDTDTTLPRETFNYALSDIAYSGNVYAFIDSRNGNIMTSATIDAGSFTVQTAPATINLSRIIFFNGKFVVAGGSGKILNGDPMGAMWTEATSGTTADLLEGEATATKIVFVGTDGKIIVSSDGTTWEDKSVVGNSTKYNRLLLFE